MAGLVPAIHVLFRVELKDVDAWDKPGHDASEMQQAKRRVDELPLLPSQLALADGVAVECAVWVHSDRDLAQLAGEGEWRLVG